MSMDIAVCRALKDIVDVVTSSVVLLTEMTQSVNVFSSRTRYVS